MLHSSSGLHTRRRARVGIELCACVSGCLGCARVFVVHGVGWCVCGGEVEEGCLLM